MEKIILVRHGETQKNKNNPDRVLTQNGFDQIRECARQIRKIIHEDSCVIFSAKNLRSVQSALILSEEIGVHISPNFLHLSLGMISKLGDTEEERFMRYQILADDGLLPEGISSPERILEKFSRYISKVNKRVIIFVGNGGILDVLLRYKTGFKISKNIIKTIFDYGEYTVLEKKQG